MRFIEDGKIMNWDKLAPGRTFVVRKSTLWLRKGCVKQRDQSKKIE